MIRQAAAVNQRPLTSDWRLTAVQAEKKGRRTNVLDLFRYVCSLIRKKNVREFDYIGDITTQFLVNSLDCLSFTNELHVQAVY